MYSPVYCIVIIEAFLLQQAAVDNANTALHLMELYRMIGKLQQQVSDSDIKPKYTDKCLKAIFSNVTN